jgi:glycosyltransferase involved in cell wall biosynthesis
MREVFERGMAEVRADAGKVERLRRWAARFSWEACARAYWEVYEEVLTATVPGRAAGASRT